MCYKKIKYKKFYYTNLNQMLLTLKINLRLKSPCACLASDLIAIQGLIGTGQSAIQICWNVVHGELGVRIQVPVHAKCWINQGSPIYRHPIFVDVV